MAATEDLFSRSTSGRPAERMPIVRYRDGRATGGSDVLAGEEPLELRLEGKPVAVTMRTPAPGQDAELAIGFFVGEAIIMPEQVAAASECRADSGDGGVVDVRLRPGASPAPGWQESERRGFYATSACGVCGKASIEAVKVVAGAVPDGPAIDPAVLAGMPEALRSSQRVFDRTGGLHAAGIFDARGALAVLREDVGRHNAVDKAIGRAAMDGLLPLSEHVLLVSGRASFEIVQKALVAGVPVVAAVSAPSTLAVRLAREGNMTLAGFLRNGGFNIYAGRERLSADIGSSGTSV